MSSLINLVLSISFKGCESETYRLRYTLCSLIPAALLRALRLMILVFNIGVVKFRKDNQIYLFL